jgi:hypothetical protein
LTRPDEHLGDLYGVERRALTELIAADEEVEAEPLGLRQVPTDSANVDRIAPRRDRRHREPVLLALVHDLDAGGLGKQRASALGRQRLLERQVDRLSVRAQVASTRSIPVKLSGPAA